MTDGIAIFRENPPGISGVIPVSPGNGVMVARAGATGAGKPEFSRGWFCTRNSVARTVYQHDIRVFCALTDDDVEVAVGVEIAHSQRR